MAEKRAKAKSKAVKVAAKATPVSVSLTDLESMPAPKKAVAPKKSKDREFIEGFLVEIKKSPLTRRDIINKIQQYLNG